MGSPDKNRQQASQPTRKKTSYAIAVNGGLAVAAVLLPFIAWLFGSMVNPTGWVSWNFSAFIAVAEYVPYIYWPVTAGILIILGLLVATAPLYKRQVKYVLSIGLFVVSVVYSLFLFSVTSTAEEDEFKA